MDSECDFGDNSLSNSSEDELILNSFKSKIFGDTRPPYFNQIRKFHELISGDQTTTEIAPGRKEIEIIVGIINKCAEEVAKIPHMSALLKQIKSLSDIFEHDMGKSSSDKYVYADKLKSFYHSTQNRQRHINDISAELDLKKYEHKKFARERSNHINRTLEKIRLVRNSLEQDVFQLIIGYDRMNAAATEATTSRMSRLNRIFRDLSKKFQITVKMHKTEENVLKNRKQKLDCQLAQWIEKYDKEIGDREDELQQLIQNYKEASAEFAALETTMNKHEIIYNQSVLERTTEEKRIFDMKLRTLMYARAAKTLQRAWRAHRAQQKRKKKRKGGKRKQK